MVSSSKKIKIKYNSGDEMLFVAVPCGPLHQCHRAFRGHGALRGGWCPRTGNLRPHSVSAQGQRKPAMPEKADPSGPV